MIENLDAFPNKAREILLKISMAYFIHAFAPKAFVLTEVTLCITDTIPLKIMQKASLKNNLQGFKSSHCIFLGIGRGNMVK